MVLYKSIFEIYRSLTSSTHFLIHFSFALTLKIISINKKSNHENLTIKIEIPDGTIGTVRVINNIMLINESHRQTEKTSQMSVFSNFTGTVI